MISVILGTSRPSYGAMLHLQNEDHIARTLDFLRKQANAPAFELVLADVLKGTDMRAPIDTSGPWVRFEHVLVESPWIARGLPAISHLRNTGAQTAHGDFFVWLDDCCEPPPNTLSRYRYWFDRNRFANALHLRMRGDAIAARDSRFELLADRTRLFNSFSVCGYMSASREAFEKLNGFDEMYDGSRQLEDGDFGWRLRNAGYNLVLDRDLVIPEQEHACAKLPNGEFYKNATRCNGTWNFLMHETQPGRVRANNTGEDDLSAVYPCRYYDRATRVCRVVQLPCNFVKPDGTHWHDSAE